MEKFSTTEFTRYQRNLRGARRLALKPQLCRTLPITPPSDPRNLDGWKESQGRHEWPIVRSFKIPVRLSSSVFYLTQ